MFYIWLYKPKASSLQLVVSPSIASGWSITNISWLDCMHVLLACVHALAIASRFNPQPFFNPLGQNVYKELVVTYSWSWTIYYLHYSSISIPQVKLFMHDKQQSHAATHILSLQQLLFSYAGLPTNQFLITYTEKVEGRNACWIASLVPRLGARLAIWTTNTWSWYKMFLGGKSVHK